MHLDVLKENVIASCIRFGKNRLDHEMDLFLCNTREIKFYKKSIRELLRQPTNDLHEALLSKSGQDFRKIWKSKFGNNSSGPFQVDGISDSAFIAANFAEHFESNSNPLNNNKRNDELRDTFIAERAVYKESPLTQSHWFGAECVGNLVSWP